MDHGGQQKPGATAEQPYRQQVPNTDLHSIEVTPKEESVEDNNNSFKIEECNIFIPLKNEASFDEDNDAEPKRIVLQPDVAKRAGGRATPKQRSLPKVGPASTSHQVDYYHQNPIISVNIAFTPKPRSAYEKQGPMSGSKSPANLLSSQKHKKQLLLKKHPPLLMQN